jgi:hypothetical protein
MVHGDALVGKWRGNRRMEWVSSTLHTTSEHGVYPALLPLMRTPRLPVVDWTDAPADLNGHVRFAERRNMDSARVPSHFKRGLTMQFKRLAQCAVPRRVPLPCSQEWPVKADSHIACRVHAVFLPCRALIRTIHAVPLPCSDSAVSFVKVRVIAENIRTANPTV